MGSHPMGPGTMLGGRYRLEVLLTEHHGARFWRATDTVLARSVAVHALASDDPRAPEVMKAARDSVAVPDPHFLRVLDCSDQGDLTWVINEWGEGISLDRMLEQRGPLPVPRAAWLVREVAEAVATAHEHGLAHGRLNPESVLVTDAGSVKLIGFITNSALEGPQPPSPVFGSLEPRERDVIDLAALLYAALTGKWPGASRSQVPAAPRDGKAPLRPRQVRAGIPRSLDALCDRVLNKEGSQHSMPIETAQEIAAALTDIVGDPQAGRFTGPVRGPIDAAAMHAEPTQMIRLPASGDPDATVAAPPPARPEPFEQPEDRPLFAETPRRVPHGVTVPPVAHSAPTNPGVSGTNPGTSTGAHTGGHTGSGTFWPFEPEEHTGGFTGTEGRAWLRTAAVIAVVIAVLAALFFAVNFVRGSKDPGTDGTSGRPAGKPVRIVAAKDFDPEGSDHAENPSEVGLAIDGNPQTGWKTVRYRRSPHLGNLKDGVGLVLDLGSEQPVKSLSISFAGEPTVFEVYAAPHGTPSTPGDLAGLQKIAGPATAGGPSYVVRPKDTVTTRFLVIWLTSLPPVSGGDFRGEIREARVYQ